MPPDRSFAYYGSPYHRLLDPPLAEVLRVAVDMVPENSVVLDIACGTGQLCLELHERKQCRVVGVDLSLRMLDYARSVNTSAEINYRHLDATDLAPVADDSFEWASVVLLVHELPQEMRRRVVCEALRVARVVLIIDSAAPLPRTLWGLGIRFVEYTFGHDHYGNFTDFLARGGIMGLLRESGHAGSVVRRLSCAKGCREAVVIQRED
jgi:SAM-dependent methyltransferase